MKKSVLLFSGGPDSTSAAYLLRKEVQLMLLTMHEPQRTRNHSEVGSATRIAQSLGLEHRIIDLASTNQLFDDVERITIGLGGGNRPGKDVTLVGFTKEVCVAPGKNEAPLSLSFLHISAAIYAAAHGMKEVIWGVHKDDDISGGWIDSYLSQFNKLVAIAGVEVSLRAPFMKYSKGQLLTAGFAAGAPLDLTFSCLIRTDGVHCGVCHGCKERAVAFRQADITDGAVMADIFIKSAQA